MTDAAGITEIANWAAAGGSAGFAFFAVRWLVVFLSGRFDKREAFLDQGMQRLVEQLQKQIDGLLDRLVAAEGRLEECQQKHADSEAKVSKLEATMQGFGDARQHAQLIIADEKRRSSGEK